MTSWFKSGHTNSGREPDAGRDTRSARILTVRSHDPPSRSPRGGIRTVVYLWRWMASRVRERHGRIGSCPDEVDRTGKPFPLPCSRRLRETRGCGGKAHRPLSAEGTTWRLTWHYASLLSASLFLFCPSPVRQVRSGRVGSGLVDSINEPDR